MFTIGAGMSSYDIAYAGEDAMTEYTSQFPLYAECRDLGHPWKRDSIKNYKTPANARIVDVRPNGSREEVRICIRCGAKKIYALDRNYARLDLPPKMEYPEGYLLPKGTGFVGRAERDAIRKVQYTILRRRNSRGNGKANLRVVGQGKKKSA